MTFDSENEDRPTKIKSQEKTILSIKPPDDFGDAELETVGATKMAEHESNLRSFQGRFRGPRLPS